MSPRQKDKLKAQEQSILSHAEKCVDCLAGYICKTGARKLDSYERDRSRYLQDDRNRLARQKKKAKES